MRNVRKLAVLVTATLTAGATALTVSPVQAVREAAPAEPVVEGLTNPLGLTQTERRLVVTEAGAGRVLSVRKADGRARVVARGLGPFAAASAAKVGDAFAIVTGEASPEAPPTPYPGSSVLIKRPGKQPRQLADLLAKELKANPDGQAQFDSEGQRIEDALSNPFAVLEDRSEKGWVLVADGGANTVWRVQRDGDVSAFYVPPTVNTGGCQGMPNNDETTVGCDSVPTGLAYGPHNRLFISALTSEVPGEGRVYVVNGRTGDLVRVIKGFSAPTGVAVNERTGTVFVSELFANRIVRVLPGGNRTAAPVTLPVGLTADGPRLHSTAWSLAEPGAGKVVLVRNRRFGPITEGTVEREQHRRPSGLGDRLRVRGIR